MYPKASKISVRQRARVLHALVHAAFWALFVPGCDNRTSTMPNNLPGEPQLVASAGSERPWPIDQRRTDRYVGSDKCAECHQEISREYYSSHPMGQSVKTPEQLNDVAQASLPAAIQSGARHYAVTMEAAGLTQTESMSDQNGIIYEQSGLIDFAIGSGTRGYTFASVRDGCLYQAPLTWYSQKQTWDLSPGYDPNDHPRFERRMSDGCIACHAGRPNRASNAASRFQTPVFHEAAIGCERCHGPGEQHVAFRSHADHSAENDSIVNPARLDPARRDSVCFQCHLHGRERILRTLRHDFDFRPGDHMSDIWVTFISKPTKNAAGTPFKAVSQAEQMVASVCYQESSGRLGCISCHDPHRTPNVTERIDFYRQRCLNCHDDAVSDCSVPITERRTLSAEESCIQCHMPGAAASDVPHTAQTDHRVLRRYEPTSAELVAQDQSAELDVFESQNQPVPNAEIQRAYALMMAKNVRLRSEAAETMNMLAPFLRDDSDDEAVLTSAARLLLQLGDLSAAEKFAKLAMSGNAESESALETLVVISQTKKDYNAAMEYLESVLRLAPWNPALHSGKASLLNSMGQHDAACAAWHEALVINPLLTSSRQGLIKSLTAAGRVEEADEQSALLNRIQSAEEHAGTNTKSIPSTSP